MKIVISGAGVAGPALAHWLLRGGHQVTIIEQADHFRTGGYIIDFWGLGYDLAERMGVLDTVRDHGYSVREVRFVRDDGSKASGFGVDVFRRMTGGRYTSLPRGDLANAIFDTVKGRVETLFGDSIAAIDQDGDGVALRLDSGATIEADMLIGADGLHSNVRHLVFGREDQFERDLGYRVAAFNAPGYEPRDPDVYVTRSWPGRSLSRFALADGSTLFLFILADEYLEGALPDEPAARKTALHRVFGGLGWETSAILKAMDSAPSLYLDKVSQIVMPRWSKGRVALLGDAAACVSLLAGEGTGLAMTEAYVLAGELARAGDDHAAAFTAYEDKLRGFINGKQAAARDFASSFAPKTRLGLFIRDTVVKMMKFPFVADRFVGNSVRDDFVLPDYPLD
ncbi:FAD-binding domain [Stakelama marina]|uniref:FAD-binding domain n=1 Tax=Stakelama marina TaxID=2826939 RepID=A0A8T4IHN8_9SPHN|nr:FAD-binding domain [Stakelama marina]MBR0553394.1 FAD-binding domain [Stakelama marina]